MRTIIDIPDELLAALDARRAQDGVSRAEMIRRAIRRWLSDSAPPTSSSDAFGIWKGRVQDSLAYEDELRGPRDGRKRPGQPRARRAR